MSGIRTIHLLWEQRQRGVYAPARYALDDNGALNLALPRPLEPRTYEITRLTLDLAAELRGSFAVETLRKLDLAGGADGFLGMTADDLYLFQPGQKIRFQPDRHVLYIDAALSGDGRVITTAFSDLAGASYALSFGEIGGRVIWTRDLDVVPTTVTLSRDGALVAMGAENGGIYVMDAVRRDLWEFEQEEPICALASSQEGQHIVYGTRLGGVGLVDGTGARRWEARLPGEVLALTLSGNGGLCAALCRPESDPRCTRLYCLAESGQIVWDYEAEAPLTGLAMSASGHYLATGSRNGTLSVYEVVPGLAQTGSSPDEALRQAEEQVQSGDLAGACRRLTEALRVEPGDVTLCTRWIELRAQLRQERAAQARERMASWEYAAAIALLEADRQDDPLDQERFALLVEARQARSRQLLSEAQGSEDDLAEASLLAALEAAPDLLEARQALHILRAHRASEADAEAERLRISGDLESAVAALELAQVTAHSPERAARLERARRDLEFAAGMAAYHALRYQEAIFQFRQVLHRDPAHAEAKRYLAFAQKFALDSPNETLTDRFRFLE